MTFAEALDREIRKQGWTQQETADKLGIHRVTLNLILNNRMSCTPVMAVKLERLFGVEASRWLILQAHEQVTEAKRRMREKALP